MKKYGLQLLAILAFSSPAFADSFGIHLTYPLTIGVQYTLDDVFGADTALRFWGNAILGDALGAQVQADAMLGRYAIVPGLPLEGYYGGGLHVGFVTANSGNASATGVLLGIQGTGGLSYALSDSLEAFFEASAGYSFGFITASQGTASASAAIAGLYYRAGFGLNFKL